MSFPTRSDYAFLDTQFNEVRVRAERVKSALAYLAVAIDNVQTSPLMEEALSEEEKVFLQTCVDLSLSAGFAIRTWREAQPKPPVEDPKEEPDPVPPAEPAPELDE